MDIKKFNYHGVIRYYIEQDEDYIGYYLHNPHRPSAFSCNTTHWFLYNKEQNIVGPQMTFYNDVEYKINGVRIDNWYIYSKKGNVMLKRMVKTNTDRQYKRTTLSVPSWHNPHRPAFESSVEISYWQNGRCHNIVGVANTYGRNTYKINGCTIC